MCSTPRLARLVIAVFSFLVVGASAAFAQDVSVNYVPGTDFLKYTTYRWVEIQGAEKADPIIDSQIKQAVEKALAAKGLKKVGYKGECVIESFTPECKAIAAAAAIWRPLAKSQDSLASDGVKYLKKVLK